MPCGGIYAVASVSGHPCFYCHSSKVRCDHWCTEWDAPLHACCVIPFLETTEGRLVLDHGHEVVVEYSTNDVREFCKEQDFSCDPDSLLEDIRISLRSVKQGADFEQLRDKFEALDRWLRNGGFLPEDWVRTVPPPLEDEFGG